MSYHDVVNNLTPDIVARLRRGIETGRWPDGRALTPEQREHSLQAVIAWEREHLPEDERVGFIDKGRKARGQDEPVSSLRWVDDDASTTNEEPDNG